MHYIIFASFMSYSLNRQQLVTWTQRSIENFSVFPDNKREGASLIIPVEKPTAADISESRVKSEVVSAGSRYRCLSRGIVPAFSMMAFSERPYIAANS